MLILRPICMYLRSFRKFIYSPEIHRFPFFFLDGDCFNVEKLELFRQSLREWILVLEAISCDGEEHQPISLKLPGCEQIGVCGAT